MPLWKWKKYKKCCLPECKTFDDSNPTNANSDSSVLREFFKRFHNVDLVSVLAAASINPLNHGKNLRIDYLIWRHYQCKATVLNLCPK